MLKKESNVHKINKSLYGLKQAPRPWHGMILGYFEAIGYFNCYINSYLYILKEVKVLILILLYVDDLLIITKYDNH